MSSPAEIIYTIKQNCRRCYCCIRECPAKAIRIIDGQASVMSERCIACGNCTVICSQNAKSYLNSEPLVVSLLQGPRPVAALIAPSLPADDLGIEPLRTVGALKQLGFRWVIEVAHGADMVSHAYAEHFNGPAQDLQIASACPAVVEYVRKYTPALVPSLVPIVSPMIATALAARRHYGEHIACIFIGPCVAKKLEAVDPALPRVVDAVLTFEETARLLARAFIKPSAVLPVDFDPPNAGLGRAFPLTGGLLRSAGLERDLLASDVIVVSGHQETLEFINDLDAGQPFRNQNNPGRLLVEALMCHGCYSGPALSGESGRIARRQRVAEFASRAQPVAPTPGQLARTFTPDDQRIPAPGEGTLRRILARTNKFGPEDELNCGACGYATCRAKAVAVHGGLAEESMCLPFLVEQAERVCHELKVPWSELRELHQHLANTEKLASMGQLAAGVAHELNNPLGTILLYTAILARKVSDRPELGQDLALLVAEAQRCKKIISNLLDFARKNRICVEPTLVSELVARAIADTQLSRESAPFPISIETDIPADLEAELDPDQMGQALINLIKNGIEAMESNGGTLRISATAPPHASRIRISVADQGRGIALEARSRVFQPFFTTKSIGKGTGLGLPIVYGIVKMHRGNIWFDTELGLGTVFTLELPIHQTPPPSSPHQSDFRGD